MCFINESTVWYRFVVMKKVCFNVLSSVMAIQREMALQRVGKTVRIEFSMSNHIDGASSF